jgi:type 1 fimbria pilin
MSVTLASVVISSCADQATAPLPPVAVFAAASSVAVVNDQHFDFPGPYDLVNQCTGETVTVTGTVSDDTHTVTTGTRVNLSDHQLGHLEGTGSLGNRYVTQLNENVAFNGYLSSSTFVINDVTNFRMTSLGAAPDFVVQRNAHLTVTPDGIVTVDRIDFTTTRKG